MTRERINR